MTKSLLMIPGPVEVDSQVLEAMARPVVGHTSPGFVETFGACLDGLRDVVGYDVAGGQREAQALPRRSSESADPRTIDRQPCERADHV